MWNRRRRDNNDDWKKNVRYRLYKKKKKTLKIVVESFRKTVFGELYKNYKKIVIKEDDTKQYVYWASYTEYKRGKLFKVNSDWKKLAPTPIVLIFRIYVLVYWQYDTERLVETLCEINNIAFLFLFIISVVY